MEFQSISLNCYKIEEIKNLPIQRMSDDKIPYPVPSLYHNKFLYVNCNSTDTAAENLQEENP
jgi:hypothetical protein